MDSLSILNSSCVELQDQIKKVINKICFLCLNVVSESEMILCALPCVFMDSKIVPLHSLCIQTLH